MSRSALCAAVGTGLLAAAFAPATAAQAPKTIAVILIDDLGHFDTAVSNQNAPTPTLKALADGGVRLGRHYTYKYCSPTRRSFLSGRYPVRLTGAQAPPCSNWLPLEFTLLPEKLGQAVPPITSHVIGKGHWSYLTTDHLPINRGFSSHVGYLAGAENYTHGDNYGPTHDCSSVPQQCFKDMWHDAHPGNDIIADIDYSSNYYSRRAVKVIQATAPEDPLFLALLYQGVHVPYADVPSWEDQPTPPGMWDRTYSNMLRIVDDGVANVTAALRAAGRWEDSLILVSADNGGIMQGNNYPLRGEKATTWEGGSRVMAFVAGGFLEAVPGFQEHLKNTTNNRFIHIADWYATLSTLVGVDPTDNVTMDGAVRPIDGIDVWPLLTHVPGIDGDGNGVKDPPAGHADFLPVTEESIIYQERYKLITNAQPTFWTQPNHSQVFDNRTGWPCRNARPTPSPSPKPNCTAVPGFKCYSSTFCGPPMSFFWSGDVDLAQCAALCAQQVHGQCRCFDYRPTTAANGNTDGCRLHLSQNDITSSGEGYAAYVQEGAWVQEAYARSTLSQVATTAAGATAPSAHIESFRPRGHRASSEGGCSVCTEEHPCLFDIVADPAETVDIALDHPDLVEITAAALTVFNAWTINGTMNPDVLKERYDCVTDTIPWWGNFSGPCCRPKKKAPATRPPPRQ